MLDRYRDDERIMHISGNNFQNGHERGGGSYYFSIYNHIWGWATWKRAWKYYTQKDLSSDKLKFFINRTMQTPNAKKYWLNIFKKVKRNQIDSWDYYWTFSILQKEGISILPNKNLVKNIGFGKFATHTTQPFKIPNESFKMNFPLKFLNTVEIDRSADLFTENIKLFHRNPFLIRAFNYLKKSLLK